MTRCHGCGSDLPPNGPHPPRKWCSDRCRKAQYSVPCAKCGRPLNGSDGRGPNAPTRCNPCANIHSGAERKTWTRAAIVLAIQEWAHEYGEPPAVPDWNPYQAEGAMNDPVRGARWRDADGRWPSFKTVYDEWGSWNAALEAAGFTSRPSHGGGGNEQRRRARAAA